MPDRYRALVLLGAYGSLRWSELVALRLDRIDLLRKRVRVESKIVETKGGLIEGEPRLRCRSDAVCKSALTYQSKIVYEDFSDIRVDVSRWRHLC